MERLREEFRRRERDANKLQQENDRQKRQIDGMRRQDERQKREIEDLKRQLTAARQAGVPTSRTPSPRIDHKGAAGAPAVGRVHSTADMRAGGGRNELTRPWKRRSQT